jgi:hypothetical protein
LEPWGSFIEPLLNPRCALSRSVGLLLLTVSLVPWHNLRGHTWPEGKHMTQKRKPQPGTIKKLTLIGGPITLMVPKKLKKKTPPKA